MRKLAVILVAAAIPALANADVNSDAKAFAKGINARLEQSTKQTDPSIVPNYQGTDVDAAKHYDSGFNIENEAQEQAATDPIAKFIVEGYNSRPKSILGPNDPIFKRLDEIDKNATSLTDTYDGCVSLPVGPEDKVEIKSVSCPVSYVKYKESTTCTVKKTARCSYNTFRPGFNTNISVYTEWNIGSKYEDWGYWEDQYATITVNIPKSTYSFSGENENATFRKLTVSGMPSLQTLCEDSPNVVLKSTTYGYGARYLTIQQYPSCSNGMVAKFKYQANVSRTHRPSLTLVFGVEVPDKCDVIFDEAVSCTPYSRSGSIVSSQCVASGERTVQGQVKANTCWEAVERYEWDAVKVSDRSACDTLQSQGCGFTGVSCVTQGDGYCAVESHTYSCSSITAARETSLCGSNLICPDGSCTADVGRSYDPATDDFKEAASRLSVAQEIADQIDMDTFTIFKGKPLECQNKTLGMSNCCKDSGWLHDIGLGSCDAEEKELGLAKEAKQTVYVGSYDRGSFLDKRTYKAYCSYPSKLGRIIIQQARPQLGLGFGSPSNPVCDGLTLEQFEQVDFNRIDLSEFYSDAMDKADSSVNPLELVQALKERMQSLYGGASQ